MRDEIDISGFTNDNIVMSGDWLVNGSVLSAEIPFEPKTSSIALTRRRTQETRLQLQPIRK